MLKKSRKSLIENLTLLTLFSSAGIYVKKSRKLFFLVPFYCELFKVQLTPFSLEVL